MWDSNGDSSKLLKICIFHNPILLYNTKVDANQPVSGPESKL